jgi:hypothetical protein
LKRIIRLLSIAVIVSIFSTGCAINRATATVDPSARLDKLQTMHVKKLDGEDGTIQKLIAEKLRARGHAVTTEGQPAANVDAVVTYIDKWMWDITMYLLELTIVIREPKTDFPMATGNSYHTSLTRKSPPEMVDEVVGNIFKNVEKKQ